MPQVSIFGGQQTYLNDSYINTLDAINKLKQKVGTLKASTLSIQGAGGGAVSLYEGGSTYGFYLAGNDIPQPTAGHTNTGATLTKCTLAWEKRKTSDSPAQEVWLLALKDCTSSGGGSGSGGEDESYTWQYAFDNIAVSNTVSGGGSNANRI